MKHMESGQNIKKQSVQFCSVTLKSHRSFTAWSRLVAKCRQEVLGKCDKTCCQMRRHCVDFYLNFLFTCFCIPRVTNGKQRLCLSFFLKPLSSHPIDSRNASLLGLVPQHDYWHMWCSAHCSEKNMRQKWKCESCISNHSVLGFECGMALVHFPALTCAGKQRGTLEAPAILSWPRCLGIIGL